VAIVLSQEDRELVILPRTVKDLCDTLKKVAACSKNPLNSGRVNR